MAVTKSLKENIKSPNGNSLAVFVDDTDSTLKLKDINGNVSTFSSYLSGGGGLNFFTTCCSSTCGRVGSVLQACGVDTTIDAIISSKNNGRIQFASDGNINPLGDYLGLSSNSGNTVLGGSIICNTYTGTTNTLAIGASNTLVYGRCGVVVGFRNTYCSNADSQRFNSIFGVDNLMSGVGERNNLIGRANGLYGYSIGHTTTGTDNVTCSARYGAVVGWSNTTTSAYCTMVGGAKNVTNSSCAVNLGVCNTVGAVGGVVGGGYFNTASNSFSKVGGGKTNTSSGIYASVVNGNSNKAIGMYSSIVGGLSNCTTSGYSTVVSGATNVNAGSCSAILSGVTNTVSAYGTLGSISGGTLNKLCGSYGFIGGGACNSVANVISSYSSVVGGLRSCVCAGSYNAVLGGLNNTMCHDYSGVIGCGITTDRACTLFVNNLSIKNIPTSSAGLPSGSVWSNAGVLTIVP